MRRLPADDLLGLPVRLHGIALGRPVDLIVDPDSWRALGFDVLCGDDVHRFLPFAAVRVGDDHIAVGSALMLLEDAELAFYRARGATLRGLRGATVTIARKPAGELRGLIVGETGAILQVAVGSNGTERLIAADPRVAVDAAHRSAA